MINNLPNGWKIEELGNLKLDISDGNYSSLYPTQNEFVENGIPFIRANNIYKNTVIDKDMRFISEEKHSILKKGQLKQNDLLFTNRGIIGQVGLVPDKYIGANINAQIVRINSGNKYTNKYLMYCFLRQKLKNQMTTLQTGSTLKQLPIKQLKKLQVSIPPLQQQEKIVKVLDLTSNLIEKQKELLKNYDLFLKSKFIEMFGDPITNPMGWEVVNFEDIMILQRGYDLPINDRAIDGEIEVYGSNGVLDYHSEAKVRNGGVITGRSGTLGKVHYTLGDYWPLNTTLFSKDLKGNNIIYLAYFLEMFKVERFSQGAGVPTLNRNLVHKEKTYKVSLELQNKFASIVEKIETMKEKENQKLKQLEDLHNSLIQKAFKGEIV